jgi:hypothetical protein
MADPVRQNIDTIISQQEEKSIGNLEKLAIGLWV